MVSGARQAGSLAKIVHMMPQKRKQYFHRQEIATCYRFPRTNALEPQAEVFSSPTQPALSAGNCSRINPPPSKRCPS